MHCTGREKEQLYRRTREQDEFLSHTILLYYIFRERDASRTLFILAFISWSHDVYTYTTIYTQGNRDSSPPLLFCHPVNRPPRLFFYIWQIKITLVGVVVTAAAAAVQPQPYMRSVSSKWCLFHRRQPFARTFPGDSAMIYASKYNRIKVSWYARERSLSTSGPPRKPEKTTCNVHFIHVHIHIYIYWLGYIYVYGRLYNMCVYYSTRLVFQFISERDYVGFAKIGCKTFCVHYIQRLWHELRL